MTFFTILCLDQSKLNLLLNHKDRSNIYSLSSTTQEMIFQQCVKDIVESVLQGYNGSIIASGQTGKEVYQ